MRENVVCIEILRKKRTGLKLYFREIPGGMNSCHLCPCFKTCMNEELRPGSEVTIEDVCINLVNYHTVYNFCKDHGIEPRSLVMASRNPRQYDEA